MLISKGKLVRGCLKDEVAIVTGAGRGIGYEAARALIWLGARVVIAEVNDKTGRTAFENLEKEFGEGNALFVKTDVGSQKDVERLSEEICKKWGKVDIVLNNATVFPIGEVKDTPIDKWDSSYGVNLRGPVLLAIVFLPDMIRRKHGVFVSVSSSGAVPFMGAYEVFKTAQGELASTIAAEVEGKGVCAFTVGPGIVRTPGLVEGGGQVASFMGKTLDALLDMNKSFEISPEAAGAGLAASIALAPKYHGQETSSIQVLREIGIAVGDEEKQQATPTKPTSEPSVVLSGKPDEPYKRVVKTYIEQSDGWKKRNLFERQWLSRDFKKNTGMSIDEMLTALKDIERGLNRGVPLQDSIETLEKLKAYYEHQKVQLRGFEKDPKKLQENLKTIDGWKMDLKLLLESLRERR
jgi:NAD(P)-dependent dehydrogenase (short-subunit alcohol dehydrogenase family)